MYAMYGKLGFGVMDEYFRIEKARKYLNTITCKKFESYEDALDYALNGFYSLNPSVPKVIEAKLNQIIFKSHILQEFYG